MLLPLLLLLTPSTITSVSFCDQENWNIVWSDDFDTLDLKNTWTIDLGGNDSKVRDSQGTVENVYIQNISKTNSVLVLRSQRQQSKNYNYTSGAINSQNKQFWKGPARVCVNAMLPGRPFSSNSNGVWPAHWLMPNTKACWPSNGEIDIMENYGGDILVNFAWGSNQSWTPVWDVESRDVSSMGEGWTDVFHLWELVRTEEQMTIYLDGREVNSIDLTDTVNGTAACEGENPFRKPHYILLNLALGGNAGGSVADIAFPTRYEIDYVRVYE